MKQTTPEYDKAELQRLIDLSMEGLAATLDFAEKAIENYNNRPCVITGAHRQAAEKEARNALVKIRTLLWKAWSENYRTAVAAEHFVKMLDEAISKLMPQTKDGQFWFKNVGMGLDGKPVNGKDGE